MRKEPRTYCPLIKKTCVQEKCKFWIRLLGKNPQSSIEIDEYDCAVSWLPILLIENAQQSRQTGAAVESFRNEMVNTNGHMLKRMTDYDEAVDKFMSAAKAQTKLIKN